VPKEDPTLSLIIDSTRFGAVEVPTEAVVEFPAGLIGLDSTRWALLAREEDSTFVWLHSIDDATLAIPVVNPWRFFGDYEVELSDDEAARIGVSNTDATDVYVTVRASADPQDFTANLRAPILISDRVGHQVINENPDSALRAPLFAELAGDQGVEVVEAA
jgi:flagellar assembly factor FliW